MGKKFTLEEIKTYIEKDSESGCLLLSEVYIDTRTKLDIKCSCGNIFQRTYEYFKEGRTISAKNALVGRLII